MDATLFPWEGSIAWERRFLVRQSNRSTHLPPARIHLRLAGPSTEENAYEHQTEPDFGQVAAAFLGDCTGFCRVSSAGARCSTPTGQWNLRGPRQWASRRSR